MQLGLPAGLLFLATVPIVLWLHLRRRTPPCIVVPSLVPWLTLLAERPRSRREVPPTLLLLLHLTIATLIALAIAEPVVRGSSESLVDRVVVLDTSTSMAAANRWDQARSLVDELARSTPGRFSLIAAGAEPRVLLWGTRDPGLVDGALGGVRPGGKSFDLDAALVLARAVAGPDAKVDVVSDVGVEPTGNLEDLNVVVVGESEDNIAITHAGARRLAGESRVFARVASFAAERKNLQMVLRLDGEVHDSRTIDLNGGATAETIWHVTKPAQIAELRVEVDDALQEDDKVVVPLDAAVPNVEVSGASDSLSRALSVLPNLRLRKVGAGSVDLGAAADVTVFVGQVAEPLPAGGVVVFAPVTGTLGLQGLEPYRVAIDDTFGHPVTAGLDLIGVRVSGLAGYSLPEWADPLFSAHDMPIAFAGTLGSSRVVVFGFDPDDSDISARLAFPLLVDRAIAWAAGRDPVHVVGVGSTLELPPAPISIQIPDGDLLAAWGAFSKTFAPGLYRVFASDNAAEPIAEIGVMAGDPAESDLRSRRSPGDDGIRMMKVSGRAPLWLWLVALAVLLCFVEGGLRAWAAGLRLRRGPT